jgi:hypothetical protein
VRDRRVLSNVLRHALKTAADEAAWTHVALVGCAAGTGARRDLVQKQQEADRQAMIQRAGDDGVKGAGVKGAGGEQKNLAPVKSAAAAKVSAAAQKSAFGASVVTAGGALSDDLCASIGRRLRLRTLVLDRACGANVTDAGLGSMLAALSGMLSHRLMLLCIFTCKNGG